MKILSLTRTAALMVLAMVGMTTPTMATAQARPTLTQDNDAAARAPFQTTVSLNFSTGTNFVGVPIPAGKRLVIDFVTVSGAAASTGGPIQPYILLESTLAGGATVNYYLPTTQSPLTTSQYTYTGSPVVYADTLNVAFAYSGFAPTAPGFAVWSVAISGHLVSVTLP